MFQTPSLIEEAMRPCPFCGGEGRLQQWSSPPRTEPEMEGEANAKIVCKRCGASTALQCVQTGESVPCTKDTDAAASKAEAAWDRRVDQNAGAK